MLDRLWDTNIGHLYGAFTDEEEALQLTRSLVSSLGATIKEELCLTYEHGNGTFDAPLTGDALLERAGIACAPTAEPDANQTFGTRAAIRGRTPGNVRVAAEAAMERRAAPDAPRVRQRVQSHTKQKT